MQPEFWILYTYLPRILWIHRHMCQPEGRAYWHIQQTPNFWLATTGSALTLFHAEYNFRIWLEGPLHTLFLKQCLASFSQKTNILLFIETTVFLSILLRLSQPWGIFSTLLEGVNSRTKSIRVLKGGPQRPGLLDDCSYNDLAACRHCLCFNKHSHICLCLYSLVFVFVCSLYGTVAHNTTIGPWSHIFLCLYVPVFVCSLYGTVAHGGFHILCVCMLLCLCFRLCVVYMAELYTVAQVLNNRPMLWGWDVPPATKAVAATCLANT